MKNLGINPKTKPVIHVKKGTEVAFRDRPSDRLWTVEQVNISDKEEHENLPVRVTVTIPSMIEGDKPGSAVVGFRPNEQVYIPCS